MKHTHTIRTYRSQEFKEAMIATMHLTLCGIIASNFWLTSDINWFWICLILKATPQWQRLPEIRLTSLIFVSFDHVWYIDQMDQMQNKNIARYSTYPFIWTEDLLKTTHHQRYINLTYFSYSFYLLKIGTVNQYNSNWKEFDRSVRVTLEEGIAINDNINDTPKYEPYFDDTMDEPFVVKDGDEYDLVANQKFILASKLRPRGEDRSPAK
jgi:hypothetical protein